MSYSLEQLRKLAQLDYKKFIQLFDNKNIDAVTLAMAAEVLGEEIEESTSFFILKRMLFHINASVREGALTGISALYYDKNIPQDLLLKIIDISNNDPSPSIRDYAKKLLEN